MVIPHRAHRCATQMSFHSLFIPPPNTSPPVVKTNTNLLYRFCSHFCVSNSPTQYTFSSPPHIVITPPHPLTPSLFWASGCVGDDTASSNNNSNSYDLSCLALCSNTLATCMSPTCKKIDMPEMTQGGSGTHSLSVPVASLCYEWVFSL